jgi:hypothetical protein
MFFVDRVQAQGTRQRKIPMPKKFWKEFPIDSIVKIELVNDPTMFYVDKVQAQGKIQRRIPLPLKFWEEFPTGVMVKVELMRKGK